MEVPKYTVRLGRFHIHALGTSIGFRLESWSANTYIENMSLALSKLQNSKDALYHLKVSC
jgi:hypothetical protein